MKQHFEIKSSMGGFLRRMTPFILVFSRQIYFSGVQSVVIIAMLALLVGAGFVTAFESVLFIDISEQGLEMLAHMVVRSLGVILPLLIFCARSITAISSELSLMAVTGEIKTLARFSVSPWRYLYIPRIIAASASTAIHYLEFVVLSFFAGTLAAGKGLEPLLFQQLLESIGPFDIIIGILRSAIFSALAVVWILRFVVRDCSSLPAVSRSVSVSVLHSMILVLSAEVASQILMSALAFG